MLRRRIVTCTCIAKLTILLPFLLIIIGDVVVETSALSTMTTPKPTPTLLVAQQNLIDELAAAANACSSAHGIQVEQRLHNNSGGDPSSSSSSSSSYKSAPISLLPNAYPRSAFDDAVRLATGFNSLVDRVSRDHDFLSSTLGGAVSAADPFTARLLRMYREIYVDDATKSSVAIGADRFGIHRSDYMLHRANSHRDAAGTSVDPREEKYTIKQVELNTIAASFAGLSCQVANLHQYLTKRYDSVAVRDFLLTNQKAVGGVEPISSCHVPSNPTLERLPMAMHTVVQRYKERFIINNKATPESSNNVVILFVVQEGETNTVDQRLLEFRLFQNHGIPVIRASLATIATDAVLSNEDGALTIHDREVALVYFRAGYAPTDYKDGGAEWAGRDKLERCRAAKCPSLGYHLAGTKKVQQALARPGVLERFFTDSPHDAMLLRPAFAGLYSLGDDTTPDDIDAIRQVLFVPGASDRYVLKPQREGGGYNFYGPDLFHKIKDNVTLRDDDKGDKSALTLDESLGEYILMERLFPPQQTALLMRNGLVEGIGDSISELGCYGTIIADGAAGTVISNEYAGFLLRTKFNNVDEGGVASGFATLSSPYLC